MQQYLTKLEAHSSISTEDLLANVAGKTIVLAKLLAPGPSSWLQRGVLGVSMPSHSIYLQGRLLDGFK